MKVHSVVGVLACLMVGTSNIQAASVDLSVRGVITPNACTPTLGQGGAVEYGKIAVKDLDPIRYTRLPDAVLPLQVSCEAAALFALKGLDNRAGSSNGSAQFGLGLINETERVGDFGLTLIDTLADGRQLSKLTSFDNGATWIWNSDEASWMQGWLQAFGSSTAGIWAPVPIKELTSQLHLATQIYGTRGMTLTEEQPIDGSATLELRYL